MPQETAYKARHAEDEQAGHYPNHDADPRRTAVVAPYKPHGEAAPEDEARARLWGLWLAGRSRDECGRSCHHETEHRDQQPHRVFLRFVRIVHHGHR